MRRAWMLVVVVMVAALVASPALAQNKWARGPVTAMGSDSITVKVNGVDTTFKVEPATRLIARGAGTAERAAEQAGKPGVKLGDFVKVGTNVEVHFKEAAGAKVATEVRPVASAEEAATEEQTATTVTGTIVSVAAASLVVKADNQDMTFAVTPKTRVTGTGIGTKARELQRAGKPTPVTEFLKAGDRVEVYFSDAGGKPTATGVRVLPAGK